jgi:hypothetical protein
MAQVTRRTIRSPWSTGIPEYVWRHQANIAAHNVTRQRFSNNSTSQISPYKAEEFRWAISFLDLVPLARRKKIKSCNSYALKHSAEVWSRQPHNPDRVENGGHGYVSNGALIAAAIYCDFPVKPIAGSFNAMIGKARGRTFGWPLVQFRAQGAKTVLPAKARIGIAEGVGCDDGAKVMGYLRPIAAPARADDGIGLPDKYFSGCRIEPLRGALVTPVQLLTSGR